MITKKDLEKAGFLEFTLGIKNINSTNIAVGQPIWANFSSRAGIILIPNGEGFIPYINAKLTSVNLNTCIPYTQIDTNEDLTQFMQWVNQ